MLSGMKQKHINCNGFAQFNGYENLKWKKRPKSIDFIFLKYYLLKVLTLEQIS